MSIVILTNIIYNEHIWLYGSDKMNVLVVSCHPDDVECYCAGTLIKCVKRGDRVIVCHACKGDKGHVVIPPDELTVIRENEAKKAGAMAGIEVISAGFGDLDIYDNNKASRDKIIDVIRYANPDFIITHNPDDYMPDHSAVSRLVFDASFAATLPNHTDYPHRFSEENGEPAKLVPIYYMEPGGGVNFVPDEYVDISEEIDLKIDMLRCHESQLKWLMDHDNVDIADSIRFSARCHGYKCGAEYAEVFKQCKAYLKGTTRRLLP